MNYSTRISNVWFICLFDLIKCCINFFFNSFSLFPHNRSWVRVRQKKRSPDLLQIPNLGTGKRISLQSLFNQTQTHRDRQCSVSNRASNQNLVPESAHEMEERDQSNFYCSGERICWYSSRDREGDRGGTQKKRLGNQYLVLERLLTAT